jgi:hypothetical protein
MEKLQLMRIPWSLSQEEGGGGGYVMVEQVRIEYLYVSVCVNLNWFQETH